MWLYGLVEPTTGERKQNCHSSSSEILSRMYINGHDPDSLTASLTRLPITAATEFEGMTATVLLIGELLR
ncbi:MAG: hypothetical protein ICV85_08220 [Tolypothrix sp. T3-bin4]|nr:hypothetical protein [Tolypothrix sp. T3-bin4]